MSLQFQPVIDRIDPNCDIAAGINENGLNHFLQTHHKINYSPSGLSIYRGRGEVEDLGIEEWTYDITEAAVVDVNPPDSKVVSGRAAWFKSIPELGRFSSRERTELESVLNEEANIGIKLPKIVLGVKFKKLDATPPPPPITVELSIEILGRVTINQNDEFEFSALDIEVDQAFEGAVNDALKKNGLNGNDVVAVSGSNICYPIGQLVAHLANSFLKARIEKFTLSLPLPSPLSLFEGIQVGNLRTQVINDTLVVCGEAIPNGKVTDGEDRFDEKDLDALNNPGSAEKNIFLALSIDFFRLMASKSLNISESDGGGGGNDVAEWRWSYWLRLTDRGPEFRQSDKIRFNVDFDAGGSAKARFKTHCGPLPWQGTKLRADLVPSDEYVEAQLRFSGKKLMLRANTRWSAVAVRPEDWWDVLGWVLSAILTLVASAMFTLLDIALNFFKIPLAEVPERFPGTQIPFSILGFGSGFSSNKRMYAVELGLRFTT